MISHNRQLRLESMPRHSFEACVRQPVTVDKYQMVRFDKVGYSVPRQVAFKTVTVKGFVNRVDVVHDDKLVTTHDRCYVNGSLRWRRWPLRSSSCVIQTQPMPIALSAASNLHRRGNRIHFRRTCMGWFAVT